MFRRFIVLIFFISALNAVIFADEPMNVGSQKQLFIDNKFIQNASGIKLIVNPPVKCGVALETDKPWDSGRINYGTIIHDGNEYRLYYRCYGSSEKKGEIGPQYFCLATSRDGLKWHKPDLGIYEFKGSRDNNIMLNKAGFVFVDPSAKAEKKYVLVWEDEDFKNREIGGLYLAYSADGLHWKWHNKRVFPFGCDTWNTVCYDPYLAKYVAYLRSWIPGSFEPGKKKPYRTVSRLEIENLFEPWPVSCDTNNCWSHPSWNAVFTLTKELPVVLAFDEKDPFPSDIYSPGVEIYPWADRIYFSFLGTFMHFIPEDNGDGPGDIHLAVSRNGIDFTRPQRTSYIGLGLADANEQDSGFLSYVPGMIRDGDYIYQYYIGNKYTHSEYLRTEDMHGHAKLMRTVQRLDGFVSVDFDYTGGRFTTPVLQFKGKKLVLNVNCSALGRGKVEIRDCRNRPLDGFKLSQCDIINRNHIANTVTWQGNSDLSSIKESVRLHFEFSGTKLYAFGFE